MAYRIAPRRGRAVRRGPEAGPASAADAAGRAISPDGPAGGAGPATGGAAGGLESRPKWLRWCARYLPAELAGTALALAGAMVAYELTGRRSVAAFAGAIAENIGFYGVIAVVEWRRQRRLGDLSPLRAGWRVLRTMVAEFGPAEVLDSLLLRPAAMYVGPLLTHGVASGVVVGKLLADLFFYAIVIPMHELTRGRASTWRNSDVPRVECSNPGSRHRAGQGRRRV